MTDEADAVVLENLMLDVLTVAQQETFPRVLLEHAELRMLADSMTGNLTAQLYRYLLADKRLTETQEIPFNTYVRVPQRKRDRLRLLFGKKEMFASGYVTVRAEHFSTFPESTVAYPTTLGISVPLVKLSQVEAEGKDD
jgi:hypothetical protein